MKKLIVGIICITLLVLAFYQKPNVVNPTSDILIEHAHTHTHPGQAKKPQSANNSNSSHLNKNIRYIDPPGHPSHSQQETGNPHFDRLAPEVQQALKDSLLLEGPMEVIYQPDGSIKLPSNGRVTQMPVAVQMPDGSIEVREYSNIPDTK